MCSTVEIHVMGRLALHLARVRTEGRYSSSVPNDVAPIWSNHDTNERHSTLVVLKQGTTSRVAKYEKLS